MRAASPEVTTTAGLGDERRRHIHEESFGLVADGPIEMRRVARECARDGVDNLKINISGCINACGHHHVGHIGILGLDRAGVENYQITLGGDGSEDATIGEKTGPGFAYDQVVPAVERIVLAYLEVRQDPAETFLQAYRRLGIGPFKAALYETDAQDAA